MAEISIIIPVFNKENYLKKTLESVFSQSFQDYEVIIVDDGSTDSSLLIAQEYAAQDARVQIVSVCNGGVSKARNIGLQSASGNWIQFLDADDIILPEYLYYAHKFAQQEKADIVFSNFVTVDEKHQVVAKKYIPYTGLVNQEQLCNLFVEYQYTTGFFGYISNKLFQRNLLKKTGAKFPEGITLAEDLDFYVHLYRGITKAAFWQGESFCYLQTNENYIFDFCINYQDQLKIQKDIRNWFVEVDMYNVHHEILDRKISEYIYYILFDANENEQDLKEICLELMKDSLNLQCTQKKYGNPLFQTVILQLFSKKKSYQIVQFFKMRNWIRTIYRRCK